MIYFFNVNKIRYFADVRHNKYSLEKLPPQFFG